MSHITEQAKCVQKMRELREEGVDAVIVQRGDAIFLALSLFVVGAVVGLLSRIIFRAVVS